MSATSRDEEYYDLLAHGQEPRRVPAGEAIFNQGDQGDGVYILRAGTVALSDGDRAIDKVSAPGLFGEMALIEREPRSLSAVAETDVELVELSARHFWVLVDETPYFARLVMSVMAQRLRRRGGST